MGVIVDHTPGLIAEGDVGTQAPRLMRASTRTGRNRAKRALFKERLRPTLTLACTGPPTSQPQQATADHLSGTP